MLLVHFTLHHTHQAAAIPVILAGRDVLMASETGRRVSTLLLLMHTGSGKTLAYALPIANQLRRDEVDLGSFDTLRRLCDMCRCGAQGRVAACAGAVPEPRPRRTVSGQRIAIEMEY